MEKHLDISTFEYDETLASERNVFIAIKGFQSIRHCQQNHRAQRRESIWFDSSVTDVSQRRYSSGLIAYSDLKRTTL